MEPKSSQPRKPGKDSKPRVLSVGLDGATFDVIKPMISRGRLPTLARLIKRGAHGTLRSTLPPITPTAWTSFFTGKNPGRHGIYDFQKVNQATYEFQPIPAGQHGQKSIWHIISDHGGKVVAVDIPFTYPPEKVSGYVLTGYGTPVSEDIVFTHPPELRRELAEVCGKCEVAVSGTKYNLQPSFFQRWDEILDSRACMLPYLMDRIDWDFFAVVFGVTDNMQHALWPFLEPKHPAYHEERAEYYRNKLFDYYERLDTELGRLLEKCDQQTTVLVMSDHGFGSTPTSKYLTKMLLDGKLLRYKSNPVTGWLMRTGLNAYYGLPFLSGMVRRLSGRQKLGLKKVLSATAILPTPENIDWAKTKAFPGGYGFQIYLNVKGRYPLGVVSEGREYETLLAEISNQLLLLREPSTGDPIVKAVHRARDVYQGPEASYAPDLIIEYHNAYDANRQEYRGELNPSLEGNHTMEGIFIAHGPHIKTRAMGQHQIIDLAPTALYLLGLPVPDAMDGRVIEEMISPEYLREHPVTYGQVSTTTAARAHDYTEEEEELVRSQLRALGYID